MKTLEELIEQNKHLATHTNRMFSPSGIQEQYDMCITNNKPFIVYVGSYSKELEVTVSIEAYYFNNLGKPIDRTKFLEIRD